MIEEIIIYPFKNMFRKKGRSLLTVLGVAIGVCSVIIINSIGSYGTYAVNNELDSLGMGGLTVAAQASDIPLSESELEAIKALTALRVPHLYIWKLQRRCQALEKAKMP